MGGCFGVLELSCVSDCFFLPIRHFEVMFALLIVSCPWHIYSALPYTEVSSGLWEVPEGRECVCVCVFPTRHPIRLLCSSGMTTGYTGSKFTHVYIRLSSPQLSLPTQSGRHQPGTPVMLTPSLSPRTPRGTAVRVVVSR